MGLVQRDTLISQLAPPLDKLLVTQLVDEFISMERRFIQRDWDPTMLDGGQFCEVLSRILYHADSGNLNLSKDYKECLSYVEKDGVQHAISPRHDALHLAKVLRTIYKFRSQRAVHISPNYSPNHMDSKLLIEVVRWCMNETLRIFWRGDREQVAKAIRELLQFDVPAIGTFEGILLVQRTDLTADEEILVLLHYAGEVGFSRRDLGQHAKRAPSSVTGALQRLCEKRQVIEVLGGRYRLTDLGSKRVREQLSEKLLLH